MNLLTSLRRLQMLILTLIFSLWLTACADSAESDLPAPERAEPINHKTARNLVSDFDWQLPAGVALPRVPASNPMTEAGFQLGRHLFYDTRLSANGNIACASCHHQNKAFTDGRDHPLGTHGDLHPRSAQTLGNVGWYASFNWASPVIVTLEHQVRGPLFGDNPHEHGLNEANQQGILDQLGADPRYQQLLAEAFPDATEWNYYRHVFPALATFIRGMTSFDAPWDDYLQGDPEALSDSSQRGLALFTSDRLNCARCHRADHFLTDSHLSDSLPGTQPENPVPRSRTLIFHNNAAVTTYEFPNTGTFESTGLARDMGRFRTPSLRNIALTAPYMHDGSLPDLRSVIATYAAGGKNNLNKDPLIQGFEISETEVGELIAFLCSLTDDRFITNPRYANPWPDANGQSRPAPQHPGESPQCLSF